MARANTAEVVAKVAHATLAEVAGPAWHAGVNTDTVSGLDAANCLADCDDITSQLVADTHREDCRRKLTFDDVDICAADAARRHFHQDVMGPRLWNLLINYLHIVRFHDEHRLHSWTPFCVWILILEKTSAECRTAGQVSTFLPELALIGTLVLVAYGSGA